MTYTEAQRKADKQKGIAAIATALGAPLIIGAPSMAREITEPGRLRDRLMRMDGDDLIRLNNPNYDKDAWDALSKITKNQDTKFSRTAIPNSFAAAPTRKNPGGSVFSGVPSRTVLAHELGHISRFKDPVVLRRVKALGMAKFLAPASYLLGTKLGLSDEQSLAGATALSAGANILNYRNTLREEFAASRNALKTLRAYNKTLTDARHKVNMRAAKNTLKYALGTYKKAAVPAVLLGSLIPTGLYGIHKLQKVKKKDD